MPKKGTRQISYKKAKLPEVALNSPSAQETLPFPIVHYPNHYGTFISFSESLDSEKYFCSCSKGSIDNYLELHHCYNEEGLINSNWRFKHDFSNLHSDLVRSRVEYDSVFQFKDKLCHRCNLSTPSLRWCHEMYGGNFKQYYGWYINQMNYKLGFKGHRMLSDKVPQEIGDKLKEFVGLDFLSLSDDIEKYDRYSEVFKDLERLVENSTREEFGFRKIGDGWVSETILFTIVCKLYRNHEVKRRFRPNWLQGLELDIFFPKLNLAFEYQGQQHFYPIEAWGGMQSLERLQERDNKKRILCKKLEIQLIEIDYTEPLTEEYIATKITQVTSEKSKAAL